MLRLSILLLLLATLALVCAPAAAQSTIHHCVAANGTPVFTDQPCSSMDATAVPEGTDHPFAPEPPAGPRACPKSRNELEHRVTEAFRAGSVNALAGLMLWQGYREHGAVHTVHDLADLMHWGFLGFADAGPTPAGTAPDLAGLPPLVPSSATSTLESPLPGTLTLKLDRPQQPNVSFAITRRAGCLWLEP